MKGSSLVSSDAFDALVDLWARGEEEAFLNRLFAMDKKRAVYVAARMAGHIMEDMPEVSKLLEMIEGKKS